ncbi:MFS transporter [Glutamicibacter sp. M10]|uniref:MFS transporter n=1 Tax=Glutamicibacter sp. M10 TaxID=3023076 RepID=UPI0021CA1442|nr:MFS transporter [Glutamicibacter sp. M10]UXN32307.1 MFS transporter [Glutamicibacter sp. M10]
MSVKEVRPGFGLLAILLSAVGIAPLFNYGLSATSDLVIRDLGITESQFGLLATVCFGCAAIGNAAFGKFSDRQPDTRLMLIIFGAATLALGLAAVNAGYILLLVAAGVSGLAQSFPNGVTNRILVQRVPSEQRINWTGIKQSGVQVSQLIGSVGFPLLAAVIGWRGASLTGAVLAAVLAILAVRILNSTPLLQAPESSPSKQSGPKSETPIAQAAPSTRYVIYALTLFGFINGVGVQATNVYLALFAVRELHFSLIAGGLTAAVAGVVGVSARVGWGRMMSRGIAAPKLLLLLASLATCGAVSFLLSEQWHCATLLWVAVILHGASALGVSVVLMAALLRAVPANRLGSASGIVSAGQFGGFTVGPLAMGLLVGSAGGFTVGWICVIGVYLCCTALGLVLVLRSASRR